MASSHLGTDWRDQWERVLRWHQKVSAIRADLPNEQAAQTDARDVVFAFFMNCYHLQDWLKNSGARTRPEVNAFISGSAPMRLCRDVCDGFKHYRLDSAHAPLHDNMDWSTATRTSASVLIGGPAASRSRLISPPFSAWVFTTAQGDSDMFALADECVAEWRAFLADLL